MPRIRRPVFVLLLTATLAPVPTFAGFDPPEVLFHHTEGASFGRTIAASGEVLVVGNDPTATPLAVIYQRVNDSWQPTQDITADVNLNSDFETTLPLHTVAIDGDTVVIGAPAADAANIEQSGAVYVYVRSGNNFVLQQRLLAPDMNTLNHRFGHSVAIDGDTIAIGAPYFRPQDSYGQGVHGGVYVFTRSAGHWTFSTKVSRPPAGFDVLWGADVALDGNRLLGAESGRRRAHLYIGAGNVWSQSQTLTPVDGETFAQCFGQSVAMFGDRIAIGAPCALNNNNPGGAVYVFGEQDGLFTHIQRLTDSSPMMPFQFGADIGLNSEHLVVGIPTRPQGGQANAYKRTNNGYAIDASLLEPINSTYLRLGAAVAAAGDTVFVADPTRPAPDNSGDSGVIYAYRTQLPRLTATPNPVAFGSVALGAAKLVALDVGNAGSATLQITSVTPVGLPFARQGGTCGNLLPIVVAPGHSCSLVYRYAPIALGPHQGVVTLQSNDPDGPHGVTLQGTGSAPSLGISPATLGFTTTLVGEQSASGLVTLSNPGAGTVQIAAISTPAAPFLGAAGGSCLAPPFTLAPGQSCLLSFRYAPTMVGASATSITITSNASSSPDYIELVGQADGPGLAVSPNPLAFGPVAAGSFVDLPLFFQSVGVATTTISSITGVTQPFTLQGSDCGPLPIALPPDGGCSLTIRYAPTAPDIDAAVITIVTDGAPAPIPVTLTGEGTAPQLAISPGSLQFGAQRLGESLTLSLLVHNPGNATLTVSSIAPPVPPFQSSGGTCGPAPFSLPPTVSCTLTYTFAPSSIGTSVQSLAINSNAPDAPDGLVLEGTGADPQLLLTPQFIDFGTVVVGQSSNTETAVLYAAGGVKISIDGRTATMAPFEEQSGGCAPAPTVILPDDFCTMSMRFDPVIKGLFEQTITLTSDANNSPDTLVLRGRGVASPPSITPMSIAFGTVVVGTSSAIQWVQITANGSVPLQIGAISTDSPEFVLASDGCSGQLLEAGASCSVGVRAIPINAGNKTASLTIPNDGSGAPHVRTLSAQAVVDGLFADGFD